MLLFDLGGVMADLGTPASDIGLDMSEADFWATWVHSASVHAWEMGRLETPEFCTRIAAELGQDPEPGFEQRLRAWHLRLFPGIEDLVDSVAGSATIALLSNTNEIHWHQVASDDVFARFDHLFLSYETGHYKPMPVAFEQVTRHFNCDPSDVLFLDDSQRNIDAAIEAGLRAHRVEGVEQSRDVIRRELHPEGT